LLKKWVLGQQALDAWGIKSYFDLYGAYFQETRQDNPVQSRFWFKAGKCFLAVREGVAVFEGLSVMVQTEVMNAMLDGKPAPDLSKVRDHVGEEFSTALTDHYADLSGYFAEIKRLNLLYSLVGLAAGIHKAQTDFASLRPRLDYWLSEYRVPEVKTPQDYPLIVRKEMVGSGQHSRWMFIDGGIEFKALMVDLNDGVVDALRDIVLKSRPDGQPLTWEAPLQGWHLPGAPPPGAAVAAPHPAKTYGKLVLPSCGGVGIDIQVARENFRPDPEKRCARARQTVLAARPAPEALSWPFALTGRASLQGPDLLSPIPRPGPASRSFPDRPEALFVFPGTSLPLTADNPPGESPLP
jgi:hypothetical protein